MHHGAADAQQMQLGFAVVGEQQLVDDRALAVDDVHFRADGLVKLFGDGITGQIDLRQVQVGHLVVLGQRGQQGGGHDFDLAVMHAAQGQFVEVGHGVLDRQQVRRADGVQHAQVAGDLRSRQGQAGGGLVGQGDAGQLAEVACQYAKVGADIGGAVRHGNAGDVAVLEVGGDIGSGFAADSQIVGRTDLAQHRGIIGQLARADGQRRGGLVGQGDAGQPGSIGLQRIQRGLHVGGAVRHGNGADMAVFQVSSHIGRQLAADGQVVGRTDLA